jgi:hypothetical protein
MPFLQTLWVGIGIDLNMTNAVSIAATLSA